MNSKPSKQPHPLESLSPMRRRRFLGLAAFASTSVIGVGVTAFAPPAAAEPGTAVPPPPDSVDPDTGWPVFSTPVPPEGYERHHLPCDRHQYVDVPHEAANEPTGGVAVLHPPYRHEDLHPLTGGTP